MQTSTELKTDLRPTLETKRLILRPFHLSDAKKVQELAGHAAVAATTASIPHPYPDGIAEEWIAKHCQWFQNRVGVDFAIVSKQTNELIGCIGLVGITKTLLKAEMGYWIGVPFWNKGYCSEAASRHMSTNPASGRVIVKSGLKKEGLLRQEFRKNGHFVDIEVYGLLREEYLKTLA